MELVFEHVGSDYVEEPAVREHKIDEKCEGAEVEIGLAGFRWR